MEQNILLIHGGGPTAVMNASLYGAIAEAKKHNKAKIFAAIGGTGGLLKENIKNLTSVPQHQLELLLTTPGSAIGTSRDHITNEQYIKLAQVLKKTQISHLLCNGGNGTMDMCGKLHAACVGLGYNIGVVGIPKTIDNDLAITDHSPGFGSAARYIAQSVQELCADVQSMPIHVAILEASGRNAGWIAAASSLAGERGAGGPDLIYLPERSFNEEEFLHDVANLIEQKGGGVVVVSEGLTNAGGNSIVPPIFKVDRSVYHGDVSSHLAGIVIKKLGYKARGEKPGLLGRASITLQSHVDHQEAILAGQVACKAVLDGENGKMVAFRRVPQDYYEIETFLADIQDVMLTERKMPDKYINARGNYVNKNFTEWCRPLIGANMPSMVSFR